MPSYADVVRSLRPELYVPAIGLPVSSDFKDRSNLRHTWTWATPGGPVPGIPGIPGDRLGRANYWQRNASYWAFTPTTTALVPTSKFSFLSWVRIPAAATADYRMILCKDVSSGTRHWQWRIDNSHKPQVIGFQGSSSASATGPSPINDGRWHMLTATYGEGSTVLRLYLDEGASPIATSSSFTQNTTGSLEVAFARSNDGAGSTFPFEGGLAHVAYWSARALTTNERRRLYLAGMDALSSRGRQRLAA